MTENKKYASPVEAAMDRNSDMYIEDCEFLELMEEYIMPNDFNTDLLEPQAVSDLDVKKILNRTMQNVRREPRRGLPKRRFWVFGLAAVMLLAMSSLAVAEFAFKQDFLGFFNAEAGQLPQQSGQEINMQAGNENGTLTVEQVVGDNQSVYVLLDFVGPEGVALDKVSYSWERAYVMLSESHGSGYYFEDLPDDDPTDNHIRMMLCLSADSSLSGQKVDLNFAGLRGYSPEDRDYTQVLAGEWKLHFKLDYTPTSTVLAQNVAISLGEATVQVNSLEISPLSVIVDLDVENPEGYAAPAGYKEPEGDGVEMLADGTERHYSYRESPVEVRLSDLLGDWEMFTLTLKDGTVLQTSGGGSNSENGHSQVIFNFNRLLNVEDIASINYLGTELKL